MKTQTTKTPRAPRNLKPEATIAADLLAEQQKAARESNSAGIAQAVRDVIGEYIAVERATDKLRSDLGESEDLQRDKLESVYLALASLAHENNLPFELCQTVVQDALVFFYDAKRAGMSVGRAATLKAQLLRAMHPNVRGGIATIIKPWADAWETETAAIAAERAAAIAESRDMKPVPTPLRAKFTSRGGAITQALQLARGKDAVLDRKGTLKTPAVRGTAMEKPADVLTWVSSHQRQARGATQPVATPVDALPKDAKPREIATARVTALVNAVQEVAKDYPAATALFAEVMTALRRCTGDRLLPSTLAESGADKPLFPPKAPPAPPAEPVQGAAELDDVITSDERRELDLLRQLHALRSK